MSPKAVIINRLYELEKTILEILEDCPETTAWNLAYDLNVNNPYRFQMNEIVQILDELRREEKVIYIENTQPNFRLKE